MSQQLPHLRCLQSRKGQGPQKKRSHTRQSIYLCGEDAVGTLANFLVPSSGNSVSSLNQTSGNEAHEKCFHMSFLMAVMFRGLRVHLISPPVVTSCGGWKNRSNPREDDSSGDGKSARKFGAVFEKWRETSE
jgi:hypothetical protein